MPKGKNNNSNKQEKIKLPNGKSIPKYTDKLPDIKLPEKYKQPKSDLPDPYKLPQFKKIY